MSVYQMHYSSMGATKQIKQITDIEGHYYPDHLKLARVVNEFQCLKEALENTDHTFIFIITKQQWPIWKDTCKKYGYDDYLLFEQPYFVHNFNYTTDRGYNENNGGGRRLRLVIFKGKGKNVG